MKILTVTTSLSEDSTTLKLSTNILRAATSAVENSGGTVETDQINIRTLTTALTDMTLTGLKSEALEAAFTKVAEADIIVSVSPVYKVAPVGLHILFWQLIDEKVLASTPVLIASTGGTPRHSLAAEAVLRPVFAYLKGIVVPTVVFAATDDWGNVEGNRALNGRIEQAVDELVSLANSITGTGTSTGDSDHDSSATETGEFGRPGSQKQAPSIDDEFDPELITPFAQLLQG